MADRTVMTRLKADISDFNRGMLEAGAAAKAFTKELDTSTDRATNLTQSILAIGPALVPLSAAAVPAIAGLSNQMAVAAAGAGVAVLAFQGVGDALKATNDYAIEPTTANFQKMNEALDKLGPAGRDFVQYLQQIRPELQKLQDAAQAGLFPGAEAGIRDLMTLMPQAEAIVSSIASGLGQVIAEAGDNLADPRWQDFFTFLENEAKPTLVEMARTLGNFTEGFANLWVAFDPLSKDFSSGFLQMSRDFAEWTDGLDKTEGFQEFIAYVERVGPKVFDTLSSLGNAFLQIIEAAAPVGEAVLPAITALADVVATLAGSDIGPLVVGVISLTSAYSRLIALGTSANSSALGSILNKSAFGGGLTNIKAATTAATELRIAQAKLADNPGMQGLTVYKENLKGVADAEKTLESATKSRNAQFRAGAVTVGATALVLSDLDEKLGLTHTAMFAMAGSVIPGWGTAIGAAAGLAIDLTHQTNNAAVSVKALQQAFQGATTLSDQQALIDQGHALADAYAKVDAVLGTNDASKVTEGLKPLEEQHKANVRAAQDQQLAEAGLADEMANTSDKAREQTLALLDNIAAKNKDADAAENAFSAETAYRQAMNDATEQAKKSNAGIDGNSEAALKNRDALDGLATSWNRVADAGDASSKDMKKARENFIAVAEEMGVGSKKAKELADDLLHLPSPKVDVKADTKAAKKAVDDIKAALDAINPFKTITLNVVKTGASLASTGVVKQKADGGPVYGPGGPRDDAIPAMLSNGEYVVNAAAASKNMSLLHAINYGGLQRMADGGSVGVSSVAAAAPVLDLEALADRLAQRPVIVTGKVMVNGREAGVFYQEGVKFAGVAS